MNPRISNSLQAAREFLPSRLSQQKIYIAAATIVLLLILNFTVLYNETFSEKDYQIIRPESLAVALYKDNDIANPRFQRARSWLVTDYYDENLRQELSSFKNFDVFDPRLATSIWLDMINENLQDSSELLPQDFTLPFTWNMIIDLSSQLLHHPYYEKIIKAKLSCQDFTALDPELQRKFKDKHLTTCVDYNYDEPNFSNPYDLPFKLTGSDGLYLEDVEIRKFSSIVHCLTGLPIPSKVVFLGAVDNLGHKKSLIVPLVQVEDTHHNLRTNEIKHSVLKEFSNHYIERQLQRGDSKNDILKKGMSTYFELHKLNEFVLKSDHGGKILSKTNIDKSFDKPTVFGVGEFELSKKPLSMDVDLFNWNTDHELDVLSKEIAQTDHNSSLLHLERLFLNKKSNLDFKEPRYWGIASSKSDQLDHFDFRFFRFNVKKEQPALHQAVLHRLTRVWFKLCHELDVPTWLNHGPLIGWYWNGMTLNYDADLDVQLPIQSLSKLTKLINDTLIYDFINEGEYINDDLKLDNSAELGLRSFYFEVADSFVSRTNLLSRKNNIDARLVDTQTGIYIDITALASFTSHTEGNIPLQINIFDKMRGSQISRFVLSQNYTDFYNGVTLKKEIRALEGKSLAKKILGKARLILNDYINDLPAKQKTLSTFVNDRNYHFYDLNELNPLIPSYYENYNTFIPSNFLKNLVIEYRDAAVILNPHFRDYKFFSELKLWVEHEECPVYEIGDGKLIFTMDEKAMNEKCFEMSDKVKNSLRHLKSYVNFHQQELETLLGGFSRNRTLLNSIQKSESTLNTAGHLQFIQNHTNHILVPEPYLLDLFY